jgi:hypothetical protein
MKNKKLITIVSVIGVAGIGSYLLYQNRQAVADMINKISEAGGVSAGGEEGTAGNYPYSYQPSNAYPVYVGTPTGESGVPTPEVGGTGVPNIISPTINPFVEGALWGTGFVGATAGAKGISRLFASKPKEEKVSDKYKENKATDRSEKLKTTEKDIGKKAGTENKLRVDEKIKVSDNIKGKFEGTKVKTGGSVGKIAGATGTALVGIQLGGEIIGQAGSAYDITAGRVKEAIYAKTGSKTLAIAGSIPMFPSYVAVATVKGTGEFGKGVIQFLSDLTTGKFFKQTKETYKEEGLLKGTSEILGITGAYENIVQQTQQAYNQPRILNKSVVQNVQAQVQATQQNVVTTSTGYSSSSANVKKASVTVAPITQAQKTSAIKTATAVGSTKFQALAKKTLK